MLGIKRYRYSHLRGETRRWKWWIFSLVRIMTSLVSVLSLGYFIADWDSTLLFSDWIEQ